MIAYVAVAFVALMLAASAIYALKAALRYSKQFDTSGDFSTSEAQEILGLSNRHIRFLVWDGTLNLEEHQAGWRISYQSIEREAQWRSKPGIVKHPLRLIRRVVSWPLEGL